MRAPRLIVFTKEQKRWEKRTSMIFCNVCPERF